MNRYLTEFIGTFFLVLAVGLVVLGTPARGDAAVGLAIGGTLMVMIFMGGHISGGHYNPAVTLAVFLRGKCPAKDVVPYWIAQIGAGAIAAALVRWVILKKGLSGGAIPADNIIPALLIEFLYTFALALVVLNAATAKETSGNSFYGLAIGFTVVAGAIAGGSVSGGAYNPAVGVGVVVLGGAIQNIWLHIVGPLAGGAVAAMVFKIQHPDDSAS